MNEVITEESQIKYSCMFTNERTQITENKETVIGL